LEVQYLVILAVQVAALGTTLLVQHQAMAQLAKEIVAATVQGTQMHIHMLRVVVVVLEP
jgi:hypothetical protein